MSMIKRWMESEREAQERKDKETCGCYWDWNGKFEVLCEKHAGEAASEIERDIETYQLSRGAKNNV